MDTICISCKHGHVKNTTQFLINRRSKPLRNILNEQYFNKEPNLRISLQMHNAKKFFLFVLSNLIFAVFDVIMSLSLDNE